MASLRLGLLARLCARNQIAAIPSSDDDWYVSGRLELNKRVQQILAKQRKNYANSTYFLGHPYQALGVVGVYGERPTEERFEHYGLGRLISSQDRVLDLGCNCGFMALYASLRTGCQADGVDLNPYMIEIGKECVSFLRLDEKVRLWSADIKELEPERPYSVVFSFATHWTDDEMYRVPLREHLEKCRSLLDVGGLLIFESHAADLSKDEFFGAMATIDDLFKIESVGNSDGGTRALFVLRKA